MSIVQYKSNTQDEPILQDIHNHLTQSVAQWYGEGSRLGTSQPEIRSYRNCFILRYAVTTSGGHDKHILVKIRRNPKMDSLWRAVAADLHANIPTEYRSLDFVFRSLAGVDGGIGVIRPLAYIETYHAIVMEEYPSRTLRQILIDQRSSRHGVAGSELEDAARKTGKWLYYFHHYVHTPEEVPFSRHDILQTAEVYAEKLERVSRARVHAQSIMDALSRRLQHVHIDSILFSQSHADMTCDNALYSNDKKVCVIDIKTRPAPIYSDLGLILTHPETFKPQIFSGGRYLSEALLKEYRTAILNGYFGDRVEEDNLIQTYSALKVLDKWTMYEELMSRYKGMKHLLSIPAGPFVTAYFQRTFRKHLDSIRATGIQPAFKVAKPADPAL